MGLAKEVSATKILGAHTVSALQKCHILNWETTGPLSELPAPDQDVVNMCENLRIQHMIVYGGNKSMQYNCYLHRRPCFNGQKAYDEMTTGKRSLPLNEQKPSHGEPRASSKACFVLLWGWGSRPENQNAMETSCLVQVKGVGFMRLKRAQRKEGSHLKSFWLRETVT